jgi:multidrug resistance efflux pump
MSNPVETKRTPAENGSVSLSDRVRSLRLGQPGARPGRSRGNVLPWAVCVILLGMTAAFGYRAYRVGPATPVAPADGGKSGQSGDAAGPSGYTMASAGEVQLQSKGYVVAVHPVQVSPKVGGMLLWVDPNLEEGRLFRKGQELARIEDVDYKAERDQFLHSLRSAEARLAELKEGGRKEEKDQAKADLEEAEENYKLAARDLERGEQLRRGSPGAIAPNELDKLRSTYRAATERLKRARAGVRLMDVGRKERIDAAEAEVRQNRAMLDKAQWRLDNCIIRAPVTGTILSKKAEEGNIVNPSAFSSGISASLCDIADLTDIEIDLSVQERDVAQVREGQRCLVMPEAYQSHKPFLRDYPSGYVGYVSRLMPTADRGKGAIPVRVRIPRHEILKAGRRRQAEAVTAGLGLAAPALPGPGFPRAFLAQRAAALDPNALVAGVFLRPDMGALVSFLRDHYHGEK